MLPLPQSEPERDRPDFSLAGRRLRAVKVFFQSVQIDQIPGADYNGRDAAFHDHPAQGIPGKGVPGILLHKVLIGLFDGSHSHGVSSSRS